MGDLGFFHVYIERVSLVVGENMYRLLDDKDWDGRKI